MKNILSVYGSDILFCIVLAAAAALAALLSYKARIGGAIAGVFLIWLALLLQINSEADALYFFGGWVPGLIWCGIWYSLRTQRKPKS